MVGGLIYQFYDASSKLVKQTGDTLIISQQGKKNFLLLKTFSYLGKYKTQKTYERYWTVDSLDQNLWSATNSLSRNSFIGVKVSPVPELSFLPALYRG